MTREVEFLYYQDLFISYSARLAEVHNCIGNMELRKVKISVDMLEAAMDGIYCDSRSDEEEICDTLRNWVHSNNGECPLFDYRTLAIVTGNGDPSYIERNTNGYIRGIAEKSDGFGVIQEEPWKANHDVISFKGFYDFQIDDIIQMMKTRAEDALEKLYEIGIRLHYMRKQRVGLNRVYDAGPIPDNLASDKCHDDGAPMFSMWWLTHVCGGNDNYAGGICENMMMMARMTHPDAEHPPLLEYFSSNTTSRVDLTYVPSEEKVA